MKSHAAHGTQESSLQKEPVSRGGRHVIETLMRTNCLLYPMKNIIPRHKLLLLLSLSWAFAANAQTDNTHIGSGALGSNTTGNFNTASGVNALGSNTTGYNNTASSNSALNSNTTGIDNTASGFKALYFNTTGNYNTASGFGGLYSNTTGSYNTASGLQALYSNTTGIDNTATGGYALFSNTTGNYNTASGLQALYSNTTGNNNTASGVNALLNNTMGNDNTATGVYALYSNTTGNNNTASGHGGLYSNTTGYNNTASGVNALLNNTTGYMNVAVGMSALSKNIGPDSTPAGEKYGTSNTAIGYNALKNNTTGWQNTAVGESSLTSNSTGQHNTAIGEDSLNNNQSGTANTSTGESSLYKNESGTHNVANGYFALNLSKGSYNVAVGPGAGCFLKSGDNNVYIGNVGVDMDTGVIRIGTSTPPSACENNRTPLPIQNRTYIAGISGVAVSGGAPVYINSDGQLGIQSSSRRFKNDIQDLDSTNQKILSLRPVSFRYKQADEKGGYPLQFGLIAEEVAEVFPELVQYDDKGKPIAVYYNLLTPLLLRELQREHANNQEQKDLLMSLQQQNETFKAELAVFRQMAAAQAAQLVSFSERIDSVQRQVPTDVKFTSPQQPSAILH